MNRRTARLPRARRLRKSKDFQRVSRDGVRRASDHFIAIQGRQRGGVAGAGPLLGVTVSRKVGTAVERNRVKRRIREWFRCNCAGLEEDSVLVVIARRGAAELGSQEVDRELRGLLL